MTYEVRSAEVEAKLRELGRDIKSSMPPGWGFTLFMYSYEKTGLPNEGAAGAMFYISSGDRADMIKALREFIAREEGQA